MVIKEIKYRLSQKQGIVCPDPDWIKMERESSWVFSFWNDLKPSSLAHRVALIQN